MWKCIKYKPLVSVINHYNDMKRIIIVLSVIFSFSLAASAQEVGRFEFEIAGGGVYPFHFDNHYAYNGFQTLLEARYNLNSKVDLGLAFERSVNYHDDTFGSAYYTIQAFDFMACADYNWRNKKEYNVFAGTEIGFTQYMNGSHYYAAGAEDGASTNSLVPCIAPRFGVELFDKLRVTFKTEMPIFKVKYFYSTITFGLVFGGKKK